LGEDVSSVPSTYTQKTQLPLPTKRPLSNFPVLQTKKPTTFTLQQQNTTPQPWYKTTPPTLTTLYRKFFPNGYPDQQKSTSSGQYDTRKVFQNTEYPKIKDQNSKVVSKYSEVIGSSSKETVPGLDNFQNLKTPQKPSEVLLTPYDSLKYDTSNHFRGSQHPINSGEVGVDQRIVDDKTYSQKSGFPKVVPEVQNPGFYINSIPQQQTPNNQPINSRQFPQNPVNLNTPYTNYQPEFSTNIPQYSAQYRTGSEIPQQDTSRQEISSENVPAERFTKSSKKKFVFPTFNPPEKTNVQPQHETNKFSNTREITYPNSRPNFPNTGEQEDRNQERNLRQRDQTQNQQFFETPKKYTEEQPQPLFEERTKQKAEEQQLDGQSQQEQFFTQHTRSLKGDANVAKKHNGGPFLAVLEKR